MTFKGALGHLLHVTSVYKAKSLVFLVGSRVLSAPNSSCTFTLPQPNTGCLVAEKYIIFYVSLKVGLNVFTFCVTKCVCVGEGPRGSKDTDTVWAAGK